jgi:hypothetical protein
MLMSPGAPQQLLTRISPNVDIVRKKLKSQEDREGVVDSLPEAHNEERAPRQEPVDDEVVLGKKPDSPEETNKFWKSYGTEFVKGSIQSLDDRAKFMITTCASLITVNFGLMLAFSAQSTLIKVSPQFFLAISALFFALSLSPKLEKLNLASPGSIERVYNKGMKWRLKLHYVGFGFFIAGLFAVAITSLISEIPK